MSYFEVSSDLFRFDREIAERAHREWKSVKATYCDAEFKVTRSEKNKEIRLAATLMATGIKPRDFACVRPLVMISPHQVVQFEC